MQLPQVGFQLYPPLTQSTELLQWSTLFDEVTSLLSKVSRQVGNDLEIDLPGNPSFPKDGYFFREFRVNKSSRSVSIVFEIVNRVLVAFPGRVFALGTFKYSNEDICAARDGYEQVKLRTTARKLHHSSEIRFCAYCLSQVQLADVVMCEICKSRAYCSSACQARDWDPEADGQGHETWCSLQVCEEGLDWEVRPISGKGLGVVAKRYIPRLSRVMVESPRDLTFPGVFDLEPLGAILIEKERLNSFCIGESSLLCVRVARMNHSCRNNACQTYQDGVMIICAVRDIHPGDEICINYTNLTGRSGALSLESTRDLLKTKWDINCAGDCVCRESVFAQRLLEARELESQIAEMLSTNNTVNALEKVDRLLQALGAIAGSPIWIYHTLWAGFTFSILQESTLQQAAVYGENAVRIYESVYHPDSEDAQSMRAAVRDPQGYRVIKAKHAAQSA